MAPPATHSASHPFITSPHRTLLRLSIPVLLSLIAEPMTGLADTAFIARLGAAELAALGVGTVVMSSLFWIFNFLGIGTQTEVARSLGAGRTLRAREMATMALLVATTLGLVLAAVGQAGVGPAATLMGAVGPVRAGATTYLAIRLAAAPALLVTSTAFGALRGLQDMRTPLRIAIAVNGLNVVLDAALIFGIGPVPALGIAGAALATVVSQWLGATWSLAAVRSRLGLTARVHAVDALRLFTVGRDLVIRTGLLTAFILLTTRTATRLSADAGAAHQAIRQVWMLSAMTLDAFAAAAQSLVGYFLGAARRDVARRVAGVACAWSVATGIVLALGMWAGQELVADWLVPEGARALFFSAWLAAALFQPLNAVSFATDGIHWGSGDYRYLRNAMATATLAGAAALWFLEVGGGDTLARVWLITGAWIAIRAVFGVLRIWPAIGASPFRPAGGT
ncbi:MAG: MATE family efflux transporter [Acidobacteriota bacterium]